MRGFGELEKVGVEQTASYGAGVVRHLAKAGILVLEVTETNKAEWRARGKDDALDAISAAQRARTGQRIQHRRVTPRPDRSAAHAAHHTPDRGQGAPAALP